MPPTLKSPLISFAILWIAFRILELFRPKPKRLPILRRGLFTDIVYWLFTPLVTRIVTGAATAIAVLPIAKAIDPCGRECRLGFLPAARHRRLAAFPSLAP
jgi:hypothetical protein